MARGKGRHGAAKKKVVTTQPPSAVKKARPGDPVDHGNPDGYPSWRFEHLDFEFPPNGNWSRVGPTELKDLAETLRHCEQKPMQQLFQTGRGVRGATAEYDNEVMDKGLTKAARSRLSELGLGDLDRICRIRLDATCRVYAWRGNGNVFNLIWWDPEHEIYPTEPKNT